MRGRTNCSSYSPKESIGCFLPLVVRHLARCSMRRLVRIDSICRHRGVGSSQRLTLLVLDHSLAVLVYLVQDLLHDGTLLLQFVDGYVCSRLIFPSSIKRQMPGAWHTRMGNVCSEALSGAHPWEPTWSADCVVIAFALHPAFGGKRYRCSRAGEGTIAFGCTRLPPPVMNDCRRIRIANRIG